MGEKHGPVMGGAPPAHGYRLYAGRPGAVRQGRPEVEAVPGSGSAENGGPHLRSNFITLTANRYTTVNYDVGRVAA
jgi:hypothetical protein